MSYPGKKWYSGLQKIGHIAHKSSETLKDEDIVELKRDTYRLGCWARKWGMGFQHVNAIWCSWQENGSEDPCFIYLRMLEGTDLENVGSIKYLGATITSDLRWNTHVSNVCTKANRTLWVLRRNLYSCPQEVKETAYKGLVRPVLDYGSSVWDPRWVLQEASWKHGRVKMTSPIVHLYSEKKDWWGIVKYQ